MDDLIRRQELENLLVVAQDEDFITLEEYDKFWDLIRRVPSAQPEQKTGRWLPHWCEDGNKDGDICSCCHTWFVMPFGKFPFCPQCGAKMEE